MNIVFSHDSALELLRLASAGHDPLPQPCRTLAAGARIDDEQALLLRETHGLALPVHLLVARSEKRPPTEFVVCHARSEPLPRGSLLRIDDGIYAASPELCFMQLPAAHGLPSQIAIGHELCGTYRVGRGYNLPPLTSVAKLEAYARRAAGMHGVVQTRRALRYVLPSSASSMETSLAMLLDLPPLLGGCSLPPPRLNARIDPKGRLKDIASQKYYKCDLLWEEAKLAVEYESNLCHTGAQRLAKDSRRRDELVALGITVVTVTASQVYNLSEFDKVAKTLARHLGERLPKRDQAFTERQLKLRTILLEPPRKPFGRSETP